MAMDGGGNLWFTLSASADSSRGCRCDQLWGCVRDDNVSTPRGGGLPGWQREMTCMTMYDKYLRRLHLGR